MCRMEGMGNKMNCAVCGEPVDTHEAGRKTDRCIAKKLGWTRISLQGTHGSVHWQAWDKEGNIVDLPFFSSKMSPDTWELVEKLHDEWSEGGKKNDFELVKADKGWIVQSTWGFRYKAPTAPLAICRAYLVKED